MNLNNMDFLNEINKRLNLKKLSRWVNRYRDDEWVGFDLKELFEHITNLTKSEQYIIRKVFINSSSIISVCKELGLSRYKVTNIIKYNIKHIASNEDIIKTR